MCTGRVEPVVPAVPPSALSFPAGRAVFSGLAASPEKKE